MGVHVITDCPIQTLIPYIDWTPFFHAWELKCRYPNILTDERYGKQAQTLWSDAKTLLAELSAANSIQAKGVYGFFPANTIEHDDIAIFKDHTRTEVLNIIPQLRQQTLMPTGKPNFALADFIAPKETGVSDYIVFFAVTAGLGLSELASQYEKAGDDYRAILLKSLGDRLAEAFAEYLHEQVRTQYWGYTPDEQLDNLALIKEQYRGIRPAPGYPACPDHLAKLKIFELLNVEQNIGVSLTEQLAMWPASSVSGYYFSHPDARYFGIGKIELDQIDSYAKRMSLSQEEIIHWLAPHVNVQPSS